MSTQPKLKSTYHAQTQASETPGLPAPWTQHKAPSGHIYYYNPDTKQSTYTHPAKLEAQAASLGVQDLPESTNFTAHTVQSLPPQASSQFPYRGHQHRQRQPQDRPKSKREIPGCSPWVLVNTKLGRRFVHNLTTNESFWKVPDHLTQAIVELDILAAKRRAEDGKIDEEASDARRASITEEATDDKVVKDAPDRDIPGHAGGDGIEAESDEYEEIEVTDNDDELEEEQEDDSGYGDENPAKRQRLSEEQEQVTAPAEMGEDDMAFQLAQMGEAYDLDPGEYGGEDFEEDWEEGADGLPLSTEEAESSFKDLLDDYRINPYTTWDAVIADAAIIDDERYTLLPNMKARRDTFATWSAAKIQALKKEKEKQTKQNPRISYLVFLEKHASPKLFWPEFKRKYKREPEIKEVSLSDKDKEKLYREHINRLTKMSESARKDDLEVLLRSIPASTSWNRSTSLDDIFPSELLTDVRYISVSGRSRDTAIQSYLRTLPSAEQLSSADLSGADTQNGRDHERMKEAVRRRERDVQSAKREQEKQLRHGQRMLRTENQELERAMKIDKAGLGRALNDQ